ncbi:hypothetical protein [Streptomyces sp. BPTC-684]|uniref:hypothetical protein n=1 Tax=Streptomyces sp. BPTC-684 TaxID=3043734 RepID=UPI0024B1E5EF|nr:hypothetical protein [Streptomyces sp. BPTC-684]WHM41543.1 hypothetical protein QIY60_01495 [Streptomyces sp. BPTC-684]
MAIVIPLLIASGGPGPDPAKPSAEATSPSVRTSRSPNDGHSATVDPSSTPDIRANDQFMTGVYSVSLPTQGTLDIDGRVVTAYANRSTDIVHIAGFVSKYPVNSKLDEGSKIGIIDDSDIPHCSTRAEFTTGVIIRSLNGESICVQTNEGRWALVQVAFPRSSDLLKLRVGFLKNSPPLEKYFPSLVPESR